MRRGDFDTWETLLWIGIWIALIFVLAVLFIGCTPLTEKAERYGEVGERFLNPDEVQIKYHREGNTVSGYEMRCFGAACEEFGSE